MDVISVTFCLGSEIIRYIRSYEHFPVFNAGLSQVHMIAGQNVKKKYLMCQIPIKMLKQEATPNSSLHNLKIYD